MADISGALGAIGGLGIGSYIGHYLSSTKERRSARAEVLKALQAAELSRWEPRAEDEPPFQEASRGLQTAALIAQIPRPVVKRYLELAQAGSWASRDSWESDHDPEFGGGIDATLADCIRLAATAVADVVWAPRPTMRLTQRRVLRAVGEKVAELKDPKLLRYVERSTQHGL